jgi:hypothetical protein
MGLLDKAKEKATHFAEQAKEKVDDLKDKRKVDELLDDLGRILYRQETGRGESGDTARIAELVAELRKLEDEGADVLAPKPAPTAAAAPADAADAEVPPPMPE